MDENDLAVEDHEGLKEAIKQLSADYKEFNQSVDKIKTFGKVRNKS